MANKPHRDTIFVEDAAVLSHQEFVADQFVLRVKAPEIAANALPGSFAHIQCATSLPMRRPLSIMFCDKMAGTVDFLYKAIGEGTRLLSRTKAGERLSIMGPIGKPFTLDAQRNRPLLLGGGVGIPPMVFLADQLRRQSGNFQPFVIMGSEVPFPFAARPSQIMVPGMPDGVIATMPILEDWKIPARLCSLQGYAGCYEGYGTDLARHWLDALSAEQRDEVVVYACGPHPMLEATVKLARDYDLPCEVSLEEFMACAVGGCAGCTVAIQTPDGLAMKRVCVDGPVFDGYQVVF